MSEAIIKYQPYGWYFIIFKKLFIFSLLSVTSSSLRLSSSVAFDCDGNSSSNILTPYYFVIAPLGKAASAVAIFDRLLRLRARNDRGIGARNDEFI